MDKNLSTVFMTVNPICNCGKNIKTSSIRISLFCLFVWHFVFIFRLYSLCVVFSICYFVKAKFNQLNRSVDCLNVENLVAKSVKILLRLTHLPVQWQVKLQNKPPLWMWRNIVSLPPNYCRKQYTGQTDDNFCFRWNN